MQIALTQSAPRGGCSRGNAENGGCIVCGGDRVGGISVFAAGAENRGSIGGSNEESNNNVLTRRQLERRRQREWQRRLWEGDDEESGGKAFNI